jgi:hypothetical protein
MRTKYTAKSTRTANFYLFTLLCGQWFWLLLAYYTLLATLGELFYLLEHLARHYLARY